MSSQDWAPVVITKKKPPTGTTVKDVDAVRGRPAGSSRVHAGGARPRPLTRAATRRRGERGRRWRR
jgi:hypothetical protein